MNLLAKSIVTTAFFISFAGAASASPVGAEQGEPAGGEFLKDANGNTITLPSDLIDTFEQHGVSTTAESDDAFGAADNALILRLTR